MNKILRVIATLLGALIIGALGSGVWEKALSPLFNKFSEWIASTLSSYSQSYSDSIYSSASSVHGDASNPEVVIMIVTLASVLLFIRGMFVVLTNNYDLNSRELKFFSYVNGWLALGVGAMFFSMSIFYSAKHSAIRDVREYSLSKMDIVRPYVGDQVYHLLYSKFLMVGSEKDFKEFVTSMQESSKDAGITLRGFKGLD